MPQRSIPHVRRIVGRAVRLVRRHAPYRRHLFIGMINRYGFIREFPHAQKINRLWGIMAERRRDPYATYMESEEEEVHQ